MFVIFSRGLKQVEVIVYMVLDRPCLDRVLTMTHFRLDGVLRSSFLGEPKVWFGLKPRAETRHKLLGTKGRASGIPKVWVLFWGHPLDRKGEEHIFRGRNSSQRRA